MRLMTCILAIAGASAGWGAQLTLSQVDQDTADIGITGVAPLVVGAYSIAIGYSPSQISVSGAQSQGHLGVPEFDTIFSTQSLANQFRVEEVSLLPAAELAPLQPASFSLARVSFQLLGSGAAAIDLYGLIGDAEGNSISTTYVGGSLTNVPEPGSLMLCAAALAILRARRCSPQRERR